MRAEPVCQREFCHPDVADNSVPRIYEQINLEHPNIITEVVETNMSKAKRFFDWLLPVGPRSVLFGGHCWFVHPFFVWLAWCRLYGVPRDPRLYVAFFVHDLGYLFQWCRNMDGPEGERHVELGASIMHRLFDWVPYRVEWEGHEPRGVYVRNTRWRDFCLYHSRFYAKRDRQPFSRLCVADKLAIVLTPAWLYLPMVRLTGEIHEYMRLARTGREHGGKYSTMSIWHPEQRQWHWNMCDYLRRWVEQHKDGRQDTWTPGARKAIDATGVWE